MYWFGARSLGHVAEKELKAWDADAFEASLAEVKRGRDKLELALEEARAHENGGGAGTVRSAQGVAHAPASKTNPSAENATLHPPGLLLRLVCREDGLVHHEVLSRSHFSDLHLGNEDGGMPRYAAPPPSHCPRAHLISGSGLRWFDDHDSAAYDSALKALLNPPNWRTAPPLECDAVADTLAWNDPMLKMS